MRRRRLALQFESEQDFLAALELLEELATEGPIQYHPVGRSDAPAAILPAWCFDRLAPLLKERGIPYAKRQVRPMSDLPPEEQARLRGLKREDPPRIDFVS